MPDTKTMMTRREAAKYAGVHYNTVRLWEKQGRITPERVMVGGVEEVRISVEQLTAIIDERGTGSGTSLLLRPESLGDSVETMNLWRLYEEAVAENKRLSEELSASNATVDQLQQQLDRCQGEYQDLVKSVLEIANKP